MELYIAGLAVRVDLELTCSCGVFTVLPSQYQVWPTQGGSQPMIESVPDCLDGCLDESQLGCLFESRLCSLDYNMLERLFEIDKIESCALAGVQSCTGSFWLMENSECVGDLANGII